MDFPIIISLLTFVMCLIASLAIYTYLNTREASKVWSRRVEGRAEILDATEDAGLGQSIKREVLELLNSLGKTNQPADQQEVLNLRQALITAGYRSAHAPVIFLGAKILCALWVLLSFALIPHKWLGFPSTTNLIMYHVLAAGAGYYAPALWLRSTIDRRQQTIMRALPDALDLMVICVEAGLGLDQAIMRVGDELSFAHPDLSEELRLVNIEMRAGKGRTESLRNLADRTGLEDIASLTAMLIQTDKFGTSVAQSLRVHCETLRTKRRQRAEEAAAKTGVKMVFPLVFCIFPAIWVVTIGPAAIKFVEVLVPISQNIKKH